MSSNKVHICIICAWCIELSYTDLLKIITKYWFSSFADYIERWNYDHSRSNMVEMTKCLGSRYKLVDNKCFLVIKELINDGNFKELINYNDDGKLSEITGIIKDSKEVFFHVFYEMEKE